MIPVCPKCDKGTLYSNRHRVLKNGTMIMRTKCTCCDYVDDIRIEPRLHQPQKRIKLTVKREDRIRELEQMLGNAKSEILKKFYENVIQELKGHTGELTETKLVDKDCKPILIHSHNNYPNHPVSRKHKERTAGTVIAVKKFVYKNGKRYGPYPKHGHYFYEVYREGNRIKQRYLGVSHNTELDS